MADVGFYVTARNGRRGVFLLGPFPTHDAALAHLGLATRYVQARDPEGWFYEYGTARAQAKPGQDLPIGKLNARMDTQAA